MFALLNFLALLSSALSAPILGLSPGSENAAATGTPTALALSDLQSSFKRPAQFARVAFCSSVSISNWTCGEPCTALGNVTFLQSGGDQGLIPLYYIAHDPTDNSIVVAHEGTVTSNILSILNDVKLGLVDLNVTRFPSTAGKGIQVHSGFQQTFERTADGLLAGVMKGLSDTGAKKVAVTGHSLGAAVATMTAAFLKQSVDPSIDVSLAVFGLPRGGNQAWADFLDSTVGVKYMTNQQDPVPIVPPRSLGFQHPSGEIHSLDQSQNNFTSCPGQDNEHCSTGNSLLQSNTTNHDGPYLGITFGRKSCPDGQ
ncbi:alpha/beta-hydrolase [Mycena alexandri]|uniref:Alpha/beta-hydrolase n=1 Tax=Mycena alexandri TaxID=1745969 RepID=A0AAD6WX51_9AGAR|nr:alpha/beta-hydrolase [Mycena alexandri]